LHYYCVLKKETEVKQETAIYRRQDARRTKSGKCVDGVEGKCAKSGEKIFFFPQRTSFESFDLFSFFVARTRKNCYIKSIMAHANVWNSHPKSFGKGSRQW